MRTMLVLFVLLALVASSTSAQPQFFDPQPLTTPLVFADEAAQITHAAAGVITTSEALPPARAALAAEQVTGMLDAWMSYDKAQYDALMAEWGGQPRYTADGEDPKAYRWTSGAWRTADHPFVITRVDATTFDFVVLDDLRPRPAESRSGATATPTFFRFQTDPTKLSMDPASSVIEFRMLAETADGATRTLGLRFVWSEADQRWLPLSLHTTDFSSPGPMFYF